MPEIKIKLDPDTHQKLKEYAKEDYRSLTNYITLGLKYLADHPYHRPGMSSTPSTYPDNTNTMSIPTEINGVQVKGVQFATKKQEKELSPIEQQIQQNKLKDQRYKWIEKTIDRLYPEYRDFPNYDEFLSANQKMYWDKPDEEFIKHIEEVKKEYEEDEENSSFDFEDTTPHSPEYLKIKNYFSEHCAPYSFEDVVAHVNNGDTKYIKNYYDIDLHDALGSPHTYDFSDEQWEEIFKILSE